MSTSLLPTADLPARVIHADVLDGLRALPDGCVQCVCTSPPYYGLRDYGTAKWEGGRDDCDHHASKPSRRANAVATSGLGGGKKTVHASQVYLGDCGRCGARRVDRQVGLEGSLEGYVGRLVEVFREVRRVLHPTGCVWLNIGDSYTSGGRSYRDPGQSKLHPAFTGEHTEATRWRPADPAGMKPKDLMGVPWMVAFALRADGWYLRSGVPWLKRNSMPESITDRPANALEYVFLFSKGERYFYDHVAVRVASTVPERAGMVERSFSLGDPAVTLRQDAGRQVLRTADRNRRNTDWFFESWQGLYTDAAGDPLAFVVNPVPNSFGHFAMWPPELVRPMILAGTPEKGVCPTCRAPWRRMTARDRKPTRPGVDVKYRPKSDGDAATAEANGWNRPNVIGNRDPQRHCTEVRTVGWEPGCKCGGEPVPATVLDPFCGTATTLKVALELQRFGLGIELNGEYVKFAEQRLAEPLGVGSLWPPPAPAAVTLFDTPEG